jgi:hypothetical protein
VTILLGDKTVEVKYARRFYIGENSEPLLCKLEDWVNFHTGLSMIMFHADPLLRRVN